uniref:Uncharacterized protein n=1 Tax=Arundo donax TaxID=35708 RepID=A0A0A9F8E3_ARUDO
MLLLEEITRPDDAAVVGVAIDEVVFFSCDFFSFPLFLP